MLEQKSKIVLISISTLSAESLDIWPNKSYLWHGGETQHPDIKQTQRHKELIGWWSVKSHMMSSVKTKKVVWVAKVLSCLYSMTRRMAHWGINLIGSHAVRGFHSAFLSEVIRLIISFSVQKDKFFPNSTQQLGLLLSFYWLKWEINFRKCKKINKLRFAWFRL